MKQPKIQSFTWSFTLLIFLSSCGLEYSEYENKEVLDNSFTGTINVTSGGLDPAGDFEGEGDSGAYSFVWDNPEKTASVNFDITTSAGGSVNVIINDAKGDQIFNETRPEGGEDTYSGITEEGKSGKWLITIKLSSFEGDGSYSIHPGN